MKLVIATLLVTGLCGLCPAEAGKESQLGVWRVKQDFGDDGVCIVGAGALPQGRHFAFRKSLAGRGFARSLPGRLRGAVNLRAFSSHQT